VYKETTMHGVPEDLNLGLFENSVLDHVTVARCSMHLVFESEAALSIEGPWELLGPGGEVLDSWYPGFTAASEMGPLHVHQCVGRRVCASTVDAPDSITLHFESGLSIRVRDTPGYESIHIEPGGIHI